MTHQNVSYAGMDRAEADKRAIADLEEWMGATRWATLLQNLQDPAVKVRTLVFAMEFAGVSGYPVQAILRKYRLADFRAWMAEDDTSLGGAAAVPTDDEGFPLPAEPEPLPQADVDKAFDAWMADGGPMTRREA